MAPNRQSANPREQLNGWSIHSSVAWVLLVLAMGVPAAAWMPGDWTVVRGVLQFVGCLAGGMLFANKGAIWQRVGSVSDCGYAVGPGERNERQALSDWRLHPKAARILLALLVVGVGGMAWVPKDWVVLRAAMQVLGLFAAGMMAARDAAIWQRTEQPGEVRKG